MELLLSLYLGKMSNIDNYIGLRKDAAQYKHPRIQLINATPSESSILSEAISQNTSHGVL